jgi:hypothetical protein
MAEIRNVVECVVDECTICLNGYKENETKQTTKCTHIFHEECLIKWLSTNNSCPLCRTELKTKQENIINNIDTSEDTYNTDNINIVREFLGDDPILARGIFGNFREYNAIDNYLTSNIPIHTIENFSYNVRAYTSFAFESITLPVNRNETISQEERTNERLARECREHIFASQVNGRAIRANSHFNIPPKNRKHR